MGPLGLALAPVGAGCLNGARVVVDFSLPAGTASLVPHLEGAALVTGTTGGDQALSQALDAAAARSAVLRADNFSAGVTLLADLVERAAAALPDADIEIVESHHRHKRDAPSGTALALGRAAARGRGVDLDAVATHGNVGRQSHRPGDRITFHALRMGDVVGEHTVWLAHEGERVQLGHVATSRDTFALGALRAARWIADRPAGRYGLRDVLGL